MCIGRLIGACMSISVNSVLCIVYIYGGELNISHDVYVKYGSHNRGGVVDVMRFDFTFLSRLLEYTV